MPGEWRAGEGYLIVTNIHKLYAPPEENGAGVEGLAPQLGLFETPPPTKLDQGAPPLLSFVRRADSPIAVFNDEAHRVRDEATHYPVVARKLDADEEEGRAWHRVLLGLHGRAGLALQVDLSATLYEEAGKAWFRHAVYDYPLNRAIADGIVKQPFLGKVQLRYAERYVDLLTRATGQRWSYLFLINDAAVGRQDVAWRRGQGRTLFRDLVRCTENAPEPGTPPALG